MVGKVGTTIEATETTRTTSPTAIGTDEVIVQEVGGPAVNVAAAHRGGGTAKLKAEPTTRPAGTGAPQDSVAMPAVEAVAELDVDRVMATEVELCAGVYSMVAPEISSGAVGEMVAPVSAA